MSSLVMSPNCSFDSITLLKVSPMRAISIFRNVIQVKKVAMRKMAQHMYVCDPPSKLSKANSPSESIYWLKKALRNQTLPKTESTTRFSSSTLLFRLSINMGTPNIMSATKKMITKQRMSSIVSMKRRMKNEVGWKSLHQSSTLTHMQKVDKAAITHQVSLSMILIWSKFIVTRRKAVETWNKSERLIKLVKYSVQSSLSQFYLISM